MFERLSVRNFGSAPARGRADDRLRRRFRRHLRGARPAPGARAGDRARRAATAAVVLHVLRPRRRRLRGTTIEFDPAPDLRTDRAVFGLSLDAGRAEIACRHDPLRRPGRRRRLRPPLLHQHARGPAGAPRRAAGGPRRSRPRTSVFNEWSRPLDGGSVACSSPTRRHGPLPLRRRPLVQHPVRARRHHHRPRSCSGSIRPSRAACSAYLAATPGDRASIRRPMPSRARSCTRRGRRDGGARRGALRPLLRQRRRDAAVRDAGWRLFRPHRRSRRLHRHVWPNIQAALRWIDQCGDRDGDGFVEYQRATPSAA